MYTLSSSTLVAVPTKLSGISPNAFHQMLRVLTSSGAAELKVRSNMKVRYKDRFRLGKVRRLVMSKLVNTN